MLGLGGGVKGVVEVEGSGTNVLRLRSSFGGSSLRLRDARAKDCCPTPPLSGEKNLSSLDTKSSEKKAPRSPSQLGEVLHAILLTIT